MTNTYSHRTFTTPTGNTVNVERNRTYTLHGNGTYTAEVIGFPAGMIEFKLENESINMVEPWIFFQLAGIK